MAFGVLAATMEVQRNIPMDLASSASFTRGLQIHQAALLLHFVDAYGQQEIKDFSFPTSIKDFCLFFLKTTTRLSL